MIFENAADLTAASVAVGDVVAETTYELTRDSLVRYAGASGDFNPIHYRDDVATSVGLPGVLAHGMLTMGIAVQPVVGLGRRQRTHHRLPGAVHAPGASSTPRPARVSRSSPRSARSTTSASASTSR